MEREDFPPDKVRVGCLWYRKQANCWVTEIHTGHCSQRKVKQISLGRDKEAAEAKWLALLAEHGYPKPHGSEWFWNYQRQRWVTELEYVHRGTRIKKRRELYTKLQQSKRALRIECGEELARTREKKERLIQDGKRRVNEYFKSRRCEAFVKGVADLEPTTKELRSVGYRQYLCPMKYHTPTKSWFAWIGVSNRKVVMLGHDQESAHKAWLLLKHCLEGGSRILLTALRQRRDNNSEPCQSA